jgi:signal transduction histidine kinase
MTPMDPTAAAAATLVDLLEERRRFTLLLAGLDLIDQGIIVMDGDLKLVAASRGLFKLFGFPPEMSRVGTPFADFVRFKAERGEYGEGDVEAIVAEQVRLARQFEPHDLERVRPDGTILAIRSLPLPNGGCVTTYTDITQQRAHERLVQERNEELDRRVRERTAELEAANAEQKRLEAVLVHAQKMEAVGELTGGLAHDFNNLLAVVIGNLDLLQDEPELRAAAKDSVDLALKASLGGATLIRQLLAFSRRQALSPKPFDLGALVASTRELLARTLGEHIEVEMRLAPDPWPALADASQVESAVANLAINARDAMPNGGRLTLETANKHLDDRYADANPDVQPGDYVMLAVSDTGTGIPPEVLNRVFEPFFTTKEQGKGSGLGLSMVYGFAKQSRGHVKIYSEVGHGTTVRLYLPRAVEEESVATLSAPVHSDPDEIDAVVLVVEDNIDVRKIVCRLLKDFGCTVIEANSGNAALEILQSDRKIDLMFSDVVMPGGMSGAELVQATRRLRPGIKTLLTTGFAEASLRNQAQFADAGEIITKPYRRQDLARKVRSVLGIGS